MLALFIYMFSYIYWGRVSHVALGVLELPVFRLISNLFPPISASQVCLLLLIFCFNLPIGISGLNLAWLFLFLVRCVSEDSDIAYVSLKPYFLCSSENKAMRFKGQAWRMSDHDQHCQMTNNFIGGMYLGSIEQGCYIFMKNSLCGL